MNIRSLLSEVSIIGENGIGKFRIRQVHVPPCYIRARREMFNLRSS